VDIYFKDGVARRASGQVQVVTGAVIGVVPPWIFAWEKEIESGKNELFVGHGFSKGDQ
jgi:hypothetical protein